MTETFTEVQDVINKVHRQAVNTDVYYEHVLDDTVEQYYSEILVTIITDMTVLPVVRNFAGLEPIDDPSEIQAAFSKMIMIVATLFGKQPKIVETDLLKTMKDYPTEEVRLAQILRHRNLLN